MKILVTGGSGQLGTSLKRYLSEKKDNIVLAPSHAELDISDRNQVFHYINTNLPDMVIHCASYNSVDLAEENVELCRTVNVVGTRNVADACKEVNVYLLYTSTDYVFDGTKTGEYSVDDVKHPLSVYGKSKSDAEDIVLQANEGNCVLRISWLFGPSKKNFVETIINAAQLRSTLQVVDDQVGTPTYTEDLAVLIDTIIQKRCSGILHATNEGFCTWADFAQEILMVVHSKTVVQRITSAEYSSKAVRPKNSRLSKSCLDQYDLPRLPTWQDALKRYLSKRMQMEE